MESRPALVLLHGWGVNANIWSPLLDSLSADFDVQILDLPGYGDDVSWNDDYSLNAVISRLLDQAPAAAHWIAWSLGATLAIEAARVAPDRFQSLQLVAATPRFLQSDDWECGVNAESMFELLITFQSNYRQGLKKFLLLQTDNRRLIRSCHQRLTQHATPSVETLENSLNLLAQTDLRNGIVENASGQWTVKTQIVAARQDHLIPLDASRWLADHLPQSELVVLPDDESAPSGHLCFLEYPQEFLSNLQKFTGVR